MAVGRVGGVGMARPATASQVAPLSCLCSMRAMRSVEKHMGDCSLNDDVASIGK